MFAKRNISVYGKRFFEFYNTQNSSVQEKVDWVFEIVRTAEQIPRKYFDSIKTSYGLYEIRIEFESNIYRVFCFFDKGNIIILLNGFQKKTQKTPISEIRLAEKLKEQYFIDKKFDDEYKNHKNKKIKK